MDEYLLDSNIILRHFLQDIPSQSEKATSIINDVENKEVVGYISILVINEVIWILKKFYKADRRHLFSRLIDLIQIENIKILEIKKEILFRVLKRMMEREIDFTDVYLHEVSGSSKIVSFDADFRKLKN